MIRAASASTAQSAATCSRRMSENEKWPIILIIVRKRLHSCFPEHAANLYLLAKSTRMRPYASYCELQPSVLKREETEIHWIRLTRLIIKEIRKESLFLSRRVCFKKYDKKLIPTVVGGIQRRTAWGTPASQIWKWDAVSYNMTETSKWCFGEKMIAAIQLADCAGPTYWHVVDGFLYFIRTQLINETRIIMFQYIFNPQIPVKDCCCKSNGGRYCIPLGM